MIEDEAHPPSLDNAIAPVKKKIEWTPEQEELLREWAEVAGSYRWLHFKAHLWYRSRNLRYMIPLIIMSTVTGTANFAQGLFPDSMSAFVPGMIGGINLIAAILTTLYQFLKISELMESHRLISINFGKFSRNLTVELAVAEKDRSTGGKELIKISRNEIDRLIEQSPTIPRHILSTYERKFSYLDLSKPEIITIRKVHVFSERREMKNNPKKEEKFRQPTSFSIATLNTNIKDTIYNMINGLTSYVGVTGSPAKKPSNNGNGSNGSNGSNNGSTGLEKRDYPDFPEYLEGSLHAEQSAVKDLKRGLSHLDTGIEKMIDSTYSVDGDLRRISGSTDSTGTGNNGNNGSTGNNGDKLIENGNNGNNGSTGNNNDKVVVNIEEDFHETDNEYKNY